MNKIIFIVLVIKILLLTSCKDGHLNELNYFYEEISCEVDNKLEEATYRPYLDIVQGFDTIENIKLPINRFKNYFHDCKYYKKSDTLVLDFGESIRGETTMKIKLSNNHAFLDYKMHSFIMEELDVSKRLLDFNLVLDTCSDLSKDTILVKLNMRAEWEQDYYNYKKNVKTFLVINDCSYCTTIAD